MRAFLNSLSDFLLHFFEGLFLISFVIFLILKPDFVLIDAIPFSIAIFLYFFELKDNVRKSKISFLKENTPKILSPIILGAIFILFDFDPIEGLRNLFLFLGIIFVIFIFYIIFFTKNQKFLIKNPKKIVLSLFTLAAAYLISNILFSSISYKFIPFIFAGFYLPFAFSNSLSLIFKRLNKHISICIMFFYLASLLLVYFKPELPSFFIAFILIGVTEYINCFFIN